LKAEENSKSPLCHSDLTLALSVNREGRRGFKEFRDGSPAFAEDDMGNLDTLFPTL
jgi:hypothetical protein